MIGKTLAHYEIIEQIGSGGMGDVYRARDTRLNREVALKVLPDEFSRDEQRRSRFVREAQAVAALKHPNIVTIYSVEEANGVNFIAMELIEGDALSKRIKSSGVSLDDFFKYAIPLADAVSNAHDSGITHRDLKPNNIMFDRDDRLKVLDFGLAKLLGTGDPANAKTVVESGDTDVGQILGTAAYMSPEQAEGKLIDSRSDIFSMGIVLYELATGERPFKGDTQISTISSVLKDHPRHVSEVRREMPRHVGRIVSHCLEKSPDKRYQSAKDVRNELTGLKKEVDSGELSADYESGVRMGTSTHVGQAQGSGGGKRLPMPAIIAGVVVVVAAVLAFALWPRGDGGEGTAIQATGQGSTPTPVTPPAAPAINDERDMAVVLPFDNLGSEDDAYFAAGMTDELTSRLSAVKGIGIISRTSARQYDRSGKTVRQIGEDLGVDYVVEGSVRFAKNSDGPGRVRITPLLIRVSDDTQIWSQTYDRDIDDVFEVQTEIANNVVNALGVTLGTSEQEIVAAVPTNNMAAYEAYIRGKDYRDPGGNFVAGDAETVRLLTLATELDPDFLEPWVTLSQHHSVVYASPIDKTEARINAARAALQHAEAIDKDHPLTRLARGHYYYYGFRDYDRALQEYLDVTKERPNDADALASVAYIYRRQGRFAEHVEMLERAFALDPRNAGTAVNLGSTYRALREHETAVKYFDLAREIDPGEFESLFGTAFALMAWKGDYEEITKMLADHPPSIPRLFVEAFVNIRYGHYDKARAAAEQIPNISDEFTTWKTGTLATASYFQYGVDGAMEELLATEELARKVIAESPGNAGIRSTLAMALALQGRGDEAIREAKLAVDIQAKDKFDGPERLQDLALVYTFAGRHDEAIDLLEQLLDTNYSNAITVIDLQQDPAWAQLRELPRFKALIPPNI